LDAERPQTIQNCTNGLATDAEVHAILFPGAGFPIGVEG